MNIPQKEQERMWFKLQILTYQTMYVIKNNCLPKKKINNKFTSVTILNLLFQASVSL